MLVKGLRAAQVAVRVVWLAGAAMLVALVALPLALPVLGHQIIVVRGSSMEPAIHLGSVVLDRAVTPQSVAVGDVVTYRLPQGTLVTHRVTAISTDTGLAFTTKGDANASPDPAPVQPSEIVGGVESSVPVVGFLISTVGSPIGAGLVIAILASLLVVGWSIDRLVREMSGAPPDPVPLTAGAVR